MNDVARAKVVGVAGGSGAGKGALVRGLSQKYSTAVLELDAYYVDRSALSSGARARLNFDEPAAIEIGLVVEHVAGLMAGRPIERPVYSFTSHTRQGTVRMEPAPVVIVDGLFTLWWPELRSQLDLRIYVDAAADLRLARRLARDVGERGRDIESIIEQYVATVRPMHLRYVESTRAFADLVITNDGDLSLGIEAMCQAVDMVMDAAKTRVACCATSSCPPA